MLSLEQALDSLKQHIGPVEPQTVDVSQALGQVLRQDLSTREDLPAFDRSAVDGYAIAQTDPSSDFSIVASLPAGQTSSLHLEPGQCVRITTGAAIPSGADQVIMQELAHVEGNKVRFQQRPRETHVRLRGEDAQAGEVLLHSGWPLRAIEMGTLALLGVKEIAVSRKIRVTHLVSGDELSLPGQEPLLGQIRDSNSPMMIALLGGSPIQLIHQRHLPDHLEAAWAIVQQTQTPDIDLLLLSGGASVGDHDHAATLLERLDFKIHFRSLNLRPGRPLIFATRNQQVAFAIPGNPVSHLVCFELLIRPALRLLQADLNQTPWSVGTLGACFDYSPHPRETFWPATSKLHGGEMQLHPLRWQSSGHLSGLVGANALLRLPSGSGPFVRGTRLEFLPI